MPTRVEPRDPVWGPPKAVGAGDGRGGWNDSKFGSQRSLRLPAETEPLNDRALLDTHAQCWGPCSSCAEPWHCAGSARALFFSVPPPKPIC